MNILDSFKQYISHQKDIYNKAVSKGISTSFITNVNNNQVFQDRLLFVAMMYSETNNKKYETFLKNAYLIYHKLYEDGFSFYLSIRVMRDLLDVNYLLHKDQVYGFLDSIEQSE